MITSRRNFLSGLGALVIAHHGNLAQTNNAPANVKDSISQPTQEKTYNVIFSYMAPYDDRFSVDIENDVFQRRGSFKPAGWAYSGTPQEIGNSLQKLLRAEKMPDISAPSGYLEYIARQLSRDSEFLSDNFKFDGARLEDNGFSHLLNYSEYMIPPSGSSVRTVTDLGLRAIMEHDGTVRVIQLAGYRCRKFNGMSVNNYLRGGATYEIMAGPSEENFRLELAPADKNDKLTLSFVDVLGHRKRLLDGLRNQNLMFTSDWKPIRK